MAKKKAKIKVLQGGRAGHVLRQDQPQQMEPTQSMDQKLSDMGQPSSQPLVLLNFPNPTPVSLVMRKLARDAEWVIIMNPALDRDIQIFSQKKLPLSEMEFVLIESLKSVGLRLLKNERGIYRVAKLRELQTVT